jgi:hypothetical protein
MTMTLEGLGKGIFAMTTYFHDRDFSQGLLDVLIDDALGSGRQVAAGVAQTSGAGPSSIADATFLLYSNGLDPITLSFLEDPGASNVALSGFALSEAVPEPATLSLLTLGALGLLRRRR